jgi:hypothetical protein
LLPLSIVLMGFANWRQVCPLAWFGELGRKLNHGKQRRVPRWFERWFFVVTFVVLLAMLVLRLVATNGDGWWLSGLLAGAAMAAVLTNGIFTGKTWCNFVCPVGLVERIYTEPNSLPRTANSQCVRCTACKSSCPDIDQENAYWRDLTTRARRIAIYAFPGLVLGFYTYYWLRYGDWEAYFDGRWTRLPVSTDLVFGAGFFFVPAVPAFVAATLTLLGFSLAAYVVFRAIEALIRRVLLDEERSRHVALGLAAFTAFSIFYVFAGAPTLREIPGGVRTLAFVAPLLATLFLVQRLTRTHQGFIREKSAAALLRSWPFEEPPPDDPAEVWARVKAGEFAQEQKFAAYANTVRGVIADGLIRVDQLRLLEGVREQLGISERDHQKILARLTEEERDMLDQDRVGGIEERVQLDGYETALAEAMLRHAPTNEIVELRRAFGVSREAHEALIKRMRGESGPLQSRARCQMVRATSIQGDLAMVSGTSGSQAEAFLAYILGKARDAAIDHVLEYLEIAAGGDRVAALRSGLFGDTVEMRRSAIERLRDVCPPSEDLIDELEPMVVDRTPTPTPYARKATEDMLQRRLQTADPYMRAALVWVAGTMHSEVAQALVHDALRDPHELVCETAELASRDDEEMTTEQSFTSMATIEKMQFLRRVPLFVDLDPEDLHDLCLLAQEATISPPDVVCEQGAVDANDLFVLLRGRASVVIQGQDGEREVAELGPGEVIGELSLLDGHPRSATVRPKDGPLQVLRIAGQSFRGRLLQRWRVAQPLLVTLAQRVRNVSRRVVET